MKDLVTERLKLKDLYPERAEALAKEHKIDVEDLVKDICGEITAKIIGHEYFEYLKELEKKQNEK